MIFTRIEMLYFVLPLLIVVILIRRRSGKNYFTHPLLDYLRSKLQKTSSIVYLPKLLEYFALGFLVIALLNPVFPLVEYSVMKESVDILLILDLSSSMQEPFDLDGARERARRGIIRKEKTRLDAAKAAMIDFVKRRQNDRIGLVVFSEHAYVVAPITVDTAYLTSYLRMIDSKTLAGEGLTAIGEGIFTAVNFHAQQTLGIKAKNDYHGSKNRLIVVLTDGENNTGRDVYMAIRKASKAGFKISFIGVEVKWAPDAPSLIAAVKNTGGNYYDVRDAGQLQKAYHDIDLLQKETYIARKQGLQLPRFQYFAMVSFFLFVTGIALKSVPFFIEIS